MSDVPARLALGPVARPLSLVAAVLLLAACQTGTPAPQVNRAAPPPSAPMATIPADACWTTDRVPAVTRTVLVPGADGARQPRDEVLHPAEDRLFAVPCPHQLTPDLIASLQRALAVRGLHAGAVTGVLDSETAAAVRRFQAPLGLDSAVLSLEAAQRLGLIAVARAIP